MDELTQFVQLDINLGQVQHKVELPLPLPKEEL